jgi:uncharacterized membrane protein YkvA (DUF1232 family)
VNRDALPGGSPDEDETARPTAAVPPHLPREWKSRDRSWAKEAVALLPDLGRLLRSLVGDPRVPLRAKVVAGAAAAYVTWPLDLVPDFIPMVGGVDDLVVVVVAIRHLVATAGYDLVRELWTGTDDGFTMLIVLAGVER